MITGRLHTVDIDAGIDPFPVFGDQLRDIDISPPADKVSASVLLHAFIGPVEAAVAGLHVGVDKDIVPVLLLVDRVPEEDPDSVLRAGTDITVSSFCDLLCLVEDPSPLSHGEEQKPVPEFSHIAFVGIAGSDDTGEVVDLGHLDGAVLAGQGPPGAAAVVGQANGLPGQTGHILAGEIHALLKRLHEKRHMMNSFRSHFPQSLQRGIIAEGKLFPAADSRLEVLQDLFAEFPVFNLRKDAAQVPEQGHVPQHARLADLTP